MKLLVNFLTDRRNDRTTEVLGLMEKEFKSANSGRGLTFWVNGFNQGTDNNYGRFMG